MVATKNIVFAAIAAAAAGVSAAEGASFSTPTGTFTSHEYGYTSYPVSSATQKVYTTTKVVDVYTTYCPSPTVFTYGVKTYTVTEATTLTIDECPCTITEVVSSTDYKTEIIPVVSSKIIIASSEIPIVTSTAKIITTALPAPPPVKTSVTPVVTGAAGAFRAPLEFAAAAVAAAAMIL